MAQQPIQPLHFCSAITFAGVTTLGGAALIPLGISFLQKGFASKSWPVGAGEVQAVLLKLYIDGILAPKSPGTIFRLPMIMK